MIFSLVLNDFFSLFNFVKALSIIIFFSDNPAMLEAATKRYIGSGTIGQSIEQSTIIFFFGLCLMMLAIIASNTQPQDK